jgi:hypothetical protein
MKTTHPLAMTLLVILSASPAVWSQTTRPSQQPSVQQDQRGNYRQFNDQRTSRRERRQWSQGSAAFGAFAPTSQPDVAPTPTPRDMTGNYLILTVRSIFYKGFFQPPGDRPAAQSGPPIEAVLIFNGAAKNNDSSLVAFLEDNESGKITEVHIGDKVAAGKITNISLDSLDYQGGSGTVHLGIGQNLAGEQVWGAGAPSTTASTPDLSGPQADILKKMMLRRQQELAGTK